MMPLRRPRRSADLRLAQALNRAHEHAEDLVRRIQRLYRPSRAGARDHARGLTLADDLANALAADLASALGRHRARDRARARDLDHALTLARHLARDLTLTLDFVRDLVVRDLDRDLDLDHALTLIRGGDLDRALSLASQAVTALAAARDLAQAGASRDVKSLLERPVVRITAPAVRVVAAAARLLPKADPGPVRRGVPQ